MTPELAAISDWVLAILPRLFLYPGGLWMVAGLAVIGWAARGRDGVRPRRWAVALAQADLGAVATAWVAVALLPLPGAQPLPAPVDRWALVALLAVSLLLDLGREDWEARRWRAPAGAGITLALLAPLAGEPGLLASGEELTASWAAWVAVFAVGAGIVALLWSGDVGLGSEVRGLAWLAIGLEPLWALLPFGWVTPTLAVFLAAGFLWRSALASEREIPATKQGLGSALAILWLLAPVALLLALLFPG
jgi:hypothetical protein